MEIFFYIGIYLLIGLILSIIDFKLTRFYICNNQDFIYCLIFYPLVLFFFVLTFILYFLVRILFLKD